MIFGFWSATAGVLPDLGSPFCPNLSLYILGWDNVAALEL